VRLSPLHLCLTVFIGGFLFSSETHAAPTPRVQAQLEHADVDVEVVHLPDGSHRFRLRTPEGTVDLAPEEFAARVYEEQSHRAWWLMFLNITSPLGAVWVGLGLLGQVLFTGRMVVQLFASERSKRSIIPPSFWWISLIGATMLLIYFAWRKDPIGILGQSIGWLIYVRNLHLIYSRGSPGVADDPGPEPELAER
jgi:lipid-A-disaccharide synthase-like uncharacterized protein